MQLDYPFHFDARERTAETDLNDHVRDLIEQLLFTQAGERVNRPDFGSGVMQLVFSAASPEVAAAAEFLIRGGLQQWLADRLRVSEVKVEAVEAELNIRIDYVVLATGETVSSEFQRGLAP
ncbi:phage baseplate assembly protein W [Inquilinus ginsengisoli]|uniref:GPW/gp25 family protein n=1 Tax=Inquilinus ginsengisoli TaxID=363840 RepID=UPI003D19F4A2